MRLLRKQQIENLIVEARELDQAIVEGIFAGPGMDKTQFQTLTTTSGTEAALPGICCPHASNKLQESIRLLLS